MSDQQILQIVSTAVPASIADVLDTLNTIDQQLAPNDGLKWFNLLYTIVTRDIEQNAPPGGWNEPNWITQLDLKFAALYFGVLKTWFTNPSSAPETWQLLLRARTNTHIARVQFALLGMNAHINYDLPQGIIAVAAASGISLDNGTPEYRDYEYVNTILDNAEPTALQYLATGIVGQAAEDLGKLGSILSAWSVREARESALRHARILQHLAGFPSVTSEYLIGVDKMFSFAGHIFLVPTQ